MVVLVLVLILILIVVRGGRVNKIRLGKETWSRVGEIWLRLWGAP